ncbi:MAG: hypothetical protein ACLUNQ_09840 [Oscillospiraceae bacterium]
MEKSSLSYVYRPGEVAYFHRSGAPIVLEVRKGFFNDPQYDNDNTATLDLPVIHGGIQQTLEAVDAVSTKECAFHCVDCLIPFLRDAINDALEDDGLEQVNDFARRLAKQERTWGEAEFVRYKALLAAVGQPDLTSAVQLMEEADQYELRPEVAQTWGYAEMVLRGEVSGFAGGTVPNSRRRPGSVSRCWMTGWEPLRNMA